MPAVITHDLFGREIYDDLYETIGQTKDECDAFLLGCQGPDVLFFSHLNPAQTSSWNVGSQMHRVNPSELLMAFANSVRQLPAEARAIGQSYLLGFIAHYILDSKMHPFIYSQQFAIADAGIDGLTREDGHEIHAEIESELDILTLSTKRETTISEFEPEKSILRISKGPARVISCIYKNVAAQKPICRNISEDAFSSALSAYRLTLGALYSPTGIKRTLLGAAERLFRNHSFVQAMSHRNQLIFESDFDNRQHDPWKNPWTDEVETTGFWDIYNYALIEAKGVIKNIDLDDAASCSALFDKMTAGIDFNGASTQPVLLEVQDI